MNKKLFYTQPTTDLLELRSEGALLQASILVLLPGGGGGSNFSEPEANEQDLSNENWW